MMSTYRRHHCTHTHRTHHATAKCIWRNAEWIKGEGPYAVLAYCSVLTITLHATEQSANDAINEIGETGCGEKCEGEHSLTEFAPLGQMRPATHGQATP
jgi:hypothetical protein